MSNMETANWSENVILVDADYVDKVAFDLIVNFERMLGRRIPQADLARWIDCVALDGGLRPLDASTASARSTQVVFVHSKDRAALKNFQPGSYADELNGMAFKDQLGEFAMSAYPVEDLVAHDDYFLDIVQTVCSQPEVQRVMIVPDADHIYNKVRDVLNRMDDDQKKITVFAMQPMPGGAFRQEILGYSLMAALGIRSEEIHAEG